MKRMLRSRYVSVLLVALLSISTLLAFSSCVHASTEDDARSAVEAADQKFAFCYQNVLRAAGAGADISDLLPTLNRASEFLSIAHTYYRAKNYSGSVVYAQLTSDSLTGVDSRADDLFNSATSNYSLRLYSAVTLSLVAVILVVLLSLYGWRILRERYFQRLSKMKPEIGENDKS